jgi:hypothetical protein
MSQRLRSKAMIRMQWTAVILCSAAIAINYMDRSTIAIANPQIRSEFHISAAQFGAPLNGLWNRGPKVSQYPEMNNGSSMHSMTYTRPVSCSRMDSQGLCRCRKS